MTIELNDIEDDMVYIIRIRVDLSESSSCDNCGFFLFGEKVGFFFFSFRV